MNSEFIATLNENMVNIGLPINDGLYMTISSEVKESDSPLIFLRKDINIKMFNIQDETVDLSEDISERFLKDATINNKELSGFFAERLGIPFEESCPERASPLVFAYISGDGDCKEENNMSISFPIGGIGSASITILSPKTAHMTVVDSKKGTIQSIGASGNYNAEIGSVAGKFFEDAGKDAFLADENKSQLSLFRM